MSIGAIGRRFVKKFFLIKFTKLSLFWRFQLVGWIAFLIVTFPLKWVVLGSFQSALIVSLYRESIGFLTTCGMREIYRRVYRANIGIGTLCILVLGVSMLGALLQALLCLAFHDAFDLEEEKIFKSAVVFGIVYFRGALCLAWSFLYFGIRLWVEKSGRELRLALIESKERGAKLQMLRAQMNPHFLFNALNTIRAGSACGQ